MAVALRQLAEAGVPGRAEIGFASGVVHASWDEPDSPADVDRMRAALEWVLDIKLTSPGQMAQDLQEAKGMARAALGVPAPAPEATS